MAVFSQYLRNIPVPCLTRKQGKIERSSFYMFKLFPVLLTIVVVWGFCAILTVAGALDTPDGEVRNAARTDLKFGLVKRANWFRFPYPCKSPSN